jgi:hypothetical protein
MERVVPRMGGKLFLDPAARGIVPLLPLDALRAVTPARTADPQPAVAGGGR